MDERFALVDERLGIIDVRLATADKRLNNVEAELKELHQMDSTVFSELERVHMVLLDKTGLLEKKIG